jgi:general secretion pathway protein F
MLFEVRALNTSSAIERVLLDASDAHDARRQAEARGLFVSAVAPARVRDQRSAGKSLSLVLFSQELLALLNAGLGLVEALHALQEKEASGKTRDVLQRMLDGLREGKRFSAVLAAQPQLFPPLYVGIVQAAEGTSDLPRSLARYVEYRQRADQVRAKAVSAAIYPAILMGVGASVALFLMMYVVPRFAVVYEGAGRDLPWMSRVMLSWGQFIDAHAAVVLGGLAAAAIGLARMLRRTLRGGGMLRLVMRLPAIGERARIYELSRLYLTLGMLVEGGITVTQALGTVQVMASSMTGERLQAARTAIEAGQPLSAAFETAGLTTPISLRMLRVGERTGEMGAMLIQSASFYDGEISRWIDRFTRTFEPLLMAAIGLVVGAIVVLLYMPIFDLAGDMG